MSGRAAALPHVCFVAPAIYPVLSGSTSIETVGGAEVQQTILARALRQAGYRVTVVTMDYGQPADTEIDGIRVLRAHTPHGGLPGLRFVHPRITRLWQAMALADADVYYQRASGMLTGLVAQFCAARGRRFVYAAASDADFYPQLPLIRYARDKWCYRRGLRMADAVVVQNPAQQRDCLARYGRQATIVPSCHAAPAGAHADPDGYVLWAGTVKPLKRPELLLALARRLPQLRFRLVGGGADAALRQAAAALPNLELAGFVPYAQIDAQFDGARVLVNTSEFEGFPNTFLQAWARGVPSVSFFDNGSRHEGRAVSCVVADLDAMAAQLQQLMGAPPAWQAASARVRAYFDAHHTPQAALRAYAGVLAPAERAA
ncbi:glycosyltransferase [Duganella sp. BJB488]|uniref:glycosyltransferase family 4 protein n=1 Tax=unclassified Duganella TaxID=2636909 RepID=UPI000E34CB35|nr:MULTISPECIES: glycosyltransferase family 4 protein [unclassified Duganella]NVD73926.1 glycosyltransferase family 4 protein [Duganella sp. BJB1802]RFP12396.1 glycosyltransferase [Duganella sp. BJB489]RFP16510.1 glycosyltransferase [Duganella sp. BJB488]